MGLYYQEDIDKVKNCPLTNHEGDLVLFRLIKSSYMEHGDLLPKSANPRYKATQHECESWGLSTYDNLKSAINNFLLMPEKLRSRFSHVAKVNVTSDFGIKYKTLDDKSHFTLFPIEDDKILDKFTVVERLP